MDTQIIQNQDGTFSQITTTTTPFDPVATQNQIADLQAQMAAAEQLAVRNADSQFQPQIDALQALLDQAQAQVPAIADMMTKPQQMTQ